MALSTRTFRDEVRSTTLQEVLTSALVAKAICKVDTSGAKVIQNPFPSSPTVVNQALSGNYTPAVFSTTDEALNVTREIIVAEHIFDFEDSLAAFDLFTDRQKNQSLQVALELDKYVLSEINTQSATSTANFAVVGGFTTANMISSIATAISKLSGFAQTFNGMYLVVSNTDIPALVGAQIANGFSMSDAALKNGLLGSYMGMDIYVALSSQFPTNKRIFGIKNQVSFAMPVEWKFEEKQVSGKTGYEIVTYGYTGVKAWTTTLNITGIITVA